MAGHEKSTSVQLGEQATGPGSPFLAQLLRALDRRDELIVAQLDVTGSELRFVWMIAARHPGHVRLQTFRTEREARSYAQDRSGDCPVLAVSVTRFTVGELGTRTAVAWYDGVERPRRASRPGRLYRPTVPSTRSGDP